MSCATVGDVREVAEAVNDLALVVAKQEGATDEARAAGARALAAAQAAEERSGSVIGALLSPGGVAAGLLSLAATGAGIYSVNRYRGPRRPRGATA